MVQFHYTFHNILKSYLLICILHFSVPHFLFYTLRVKTVFLLPPISSSAPKTYFPRLFTMANVSWESEPILTMCPIFCPIFKFICPIYLSEYTFVAWVLRMHSISAVTLCKHFHVEEPYFHYLHMVFSSFSEYCRFPYTRTSFSGSAFCEILWLPPYTRLRSQTYDSKHLHAH